MKKSALISLLVVGLLAFTVTPSDAWHHGHGVRGGVFIGVGPGFWWGPPYPYWWYPPPYYYPPPPVIVEQPPVYVQPQPAPPAPPVYWYYCSSAKGYYPNVPACPEAWVKVPASPQ